MPNFRYRALTQAGEIVNGTISAPTAAEVARRIEYLKLLPIETTEDKRASNSVGGRSLFGGPSAAEVTTFTRDLALLLKAGALLIVALWLTNLAGNFAESRINKATDLTPSIQVLLVKIIRIGLMVLAIVIALGAVGINLSALAVFTGAAGVGIGLGLQKIVANFVSGLILLVDKSVKPGDLVTIGDNSGRISAMKTRYISVAAGDGREFLIPNEDLVTQKVTNWTYTDKNTLVKIAFSTNYDANPRQVCKLGIATAAAHPRATKGRTPNCILTEFAEAGMKFSLTFWIADPDGMDGVKSDVMLSLWDAFKQDGIKVPYPVRELRIRGGALPVESVVEVSS